MLNFTSYWFKTQEQDTSILKNENDTNAKHLNFTNFTTPLLTQQFNGNLIEQSIEIKQNEHEKEPKLYIGFSSECINRKVKYLNYLIGFELFDSQFYEDMQGFIMISYNEQVIINGKIVTTQQLSYYLRLYKTTESFINLELPTAFHKRLEKYQQKRVILMDNCRQKVLDFQNFRHNYEYLENLNISNVGFSIWVSANQAVSHFGLQIDSESQNAMLKKKENIGFVSIMICVEFFSTKFIFKKKNSRIVCQQRKKQIRKDLEQQKKQRKILKYDYIDSKEFKIQKNTQNEEVGKLSQVKVQQQTHIFQRVYDHFFDDNENAVVNSFVQKCFNQSIDNYSLFSANQSMDCKQDDNNSLSIFDSRYLFYEQNTQD